MSDITKQIREIFEKAALGDKETKEALRETVKENWPSLPVWTTLDGAVVEEVQKATAGSGVVLTFEEGGVRKVVLAETGDHYAKPGEANGPAYMIPGGFINLSETPGSSLVPASAAPEDGRTGAAREVEEELKTPDGSPLLKVDPQRLKPMDTLTLAFRVQTSGCARTDSGVWQVTRGTGLFASAKGAGTLVGTYTLGNGPGSFCKSDGLNDHYTGRLEY